VLLVLLADTHLPRGGRRLAPASLAQLERAELVLHAGDFTRMTALDELRQLAHVEAVHGNVDDAELQALLPERLVVEVEATRIGMVHDAGPRDGRADRLVREFPGCAAVVYGHTHMPEVTRHRGVWILNPGSPTERRRSPHRSVISLEVAGDELRPRLVVLDS